MELKLYVDALTGSIIDESVGKCNRLNNCGYHVSPGMYFKAKGELEIGKHTYSQLPISNSKITFTEPAYSTIPITLYSGSLSGFEHNHFFNYLSALFHPVVAFQLSRKYAIGTSKHWPGATVFWQIDALGNVRTGKIMLYDEVTGKRVKSPVSCINWVHTVLKLPDFRLRQCLFGEHQLCVGTPDQAVGIVESEKTAILMSGLMPDYIWLATGGLHNLNPERCACLKNRKVVLFPDLKAYDQWEKQAKAIQPICRSLVLSDLLEKNATKAERDQGLDLADYLMRRDEQFGWVLTDEGYPAFWDYVAD